MLLRAGWSPQHIDVAFNVLSRGGIPTELWGNFLRTMLRMGGSVMQQINTLEQMVLEEINQMNGRQVYQRPPHPQMGYQQQLQTPQMQTQGVQSFSIPSGPESNRFGDPAADMPVYQPQQQTHTQQQAYAQQPIIQEVVKEKEEDEYPLIPYTVIEEAKEKEDVIRSVKTLRTKVLKSSEVDEPVLDEGGNETVIGYYSLEDAVEAIDHETDPKNKSLVTIRKVSVSRVFKYAGSNICSDVMGYIKSNSAHLLRGLLTSYREEREVDDFMVVEYLNDIITDEINKTLMTYEVGFLCMNSFIHNFSTLLSAANSEGMSDILAPIINRVRLNIEKLLEDVFLTYKEDEGVSVHRTVVISHVNKHSIELGIERMKFNEMYVLTDAHKNKFLRTVPDRLDDRDTNVLSTRDGRVFEYRLGDENEVYMYRIA